jgi:precorrin-2 dehydrogenase/sirohydrochlorin ferrochelatase
MEQNELYPIFLKVSQLNILIVGGGKVALEKLTFLLKSSPNANVLIVSKEFDKRIIELSQKNRISIVKSAYTKLSLKNKQLIIAATNNLAINKQIYVDAKANNILINVADTPELCDFYLGGIVTKGNVKLAISTNGKSPTLAKRMRQLLDEIIPENINELAENLNSYRNSFKDDISNKVLHLNDLTRSLLRD